MFYKSKDEKNNLSIDFYFSDEGIKLFLGEEFYESYFLNERFNDYPEKDPDFLLSILENFDVKKIDKIRFSHPFECLRGEISFTVLYFPIQYNYENKSIDVSGDDYFKILDNYYRYEIVFNSKDVHQGNKLLIKCFNSSYYVADLEYINHYPKGLEIINLDEIDNGEIELSEIEKWKRKIIIEKKSLKDKLVLLDPYNYDNFCIFYKLSRKDNLEEYYYQIVNYIFEDKLKKVRKINYKEKKYVKIRYLKNIKKF